MTRTAALLAVAISFCLVSAASAFGEASYVFKPTLSLTGTCTPTSIDSVPDPGPCPGTPGTDHPNTEFSNPNVTTDAYGNIYVSNAVANEAKIDVFNPSGFFLTEFSDSSVESPIGPAGLAVDSKGNVYLFEALDKVEKQVIKRFPPTVYEPEKGEIKYEKPPIIAASQGKEFFGNFGSIAVDSKDRLYLDREHEISIYKPPVGEAANELENKAAISGLTQSRGMAIDSVHNKIYLSDKAAPSSVIRVFELEAPYGEFAEDKISGADTPEGEPFLSGEGELMVDVDDPSGHIFVGDPTAAKFYEFKEPKTYLATITPPKGFEFVNHSEIAVDDGSFSPHPQKENWLFIPSTRAPSLGHVLAFEPNEEGPPIIESTAVSEITETEATLHARINPGSLPTEYRLEYITKQQWEEEGKSFAKATGAREGTLPKGAEGVAISVTAAELEPGTAYVLHVFAKNPFPGEAEAEKTFKTFPAEEPPVVCEENKVFRVGASALLPDCRAYELVTPPSTNGRAPSGGFSGYNFPTLRSTADGNLVSFLIEGGALPGSESAGSFSGDPYLATRGSEGWSSSSTGPSGEEAIGPTQRGLSPDQGYSFWQGVGDPALHIRYPDGHSELVGKGSLGEAPAVNGDLITAGAGHIIFEGAVKLEPEAAPAGTATVYDRSAKGPTHVVSLLPGNEQQNAGEGASYLGADERGEGIAFSIGGTIYLRLHNEETFKVAGSGSTFAGVAKEGKRVFYLEGGNLFAFDTEKGKVIFTNSASNDVTPVNVASSGARAYFVSPSVLTGEPNPNGEEAEGGEENLYLSDEGAISFVGIVTERDVEGENPGGTGRIDGLGLWQEAVKSGLLGKDPSRTTPAGTTLLFESRANLTGFESGGFAQIFRYDAAEKRLDCLSCNPTDALPTSDASLQSIRTQQFSPEPAGTHLKVLNQSSDGSRAFFQTAEPLVIGDTDKKLDVYEWEEKGVGSCKTEGGCISLISGGHSSSPDYLFAVSASGDDVFFLTADLLLPRDAENTVSIYDARVGGGFPEPLEEAPCAGTDTCQPTPTPPPSQAQPTTSVPGPDGNLHLSVRKCPKGKRAVKKGGKTTCVKKHRKHRTGSSRKGGAK